MRLSMRREHFEKMAERRAERVLSRSGCACAFGLEGLEARELLSFDPTPSEQYMLELLNRFRTNPRAELQHLTTSLSNPARSADADVDSALRFFETSGTVLSQQWTQLTAVPPLAWNEDLYEASALHTQKMIDANQQTHQAPGEAPLGTRVATAGYTNYSIVGENVYAFARSVVHAHAGFAIDWGQDGDVTHPSQNGIQNPPGHRDNMLDSRFREVGLRILSENLQSTQVGPLLVTQNLGSRFNLGNPFLVGVVFADGGSNGYGPGEGLGSVTVQIVGAAGTYIATTMSAGGYQAQVPAGVYDVTFSGAGFGSAVTYRNITVGSQNVKLDGVKGVAPPAPEIAVLSGGGTTGGIEILSGDVSPAATDGTDFGRVNMSQTLTRMFTVMNLGQAALQLDGAMRVVISGAGADRFFLVNNPSGFILPGESTSFSVRFEPVATTLSNATITIQSDDANESVYTFRIKARGEIAPDVLVWGGPVVAIVDGDTTATSDDGTGFSSVNVAGRTKARDFTIWNNGSSDLVLLTFIAGASTFVRIDGLNGADFVVVTQPAEVVAPGGTTTFRVRFNPSAAGQRFGTVQIKSNDADEGIYDFAVRGIGVLKPIIAVGGFDQQIRSGVTPSTQNGTSFGDRAVEGGRQLRTFTIRNVGSGVMDFTLSASTRVSIIGFGQSDFEVVRRPPRMIGVGQSATFKVRFDPDSPGSSVAVVRIDTVNGGSFTFNIGGAGIAA